LYINLGKDTNSALPIADIKLKVAAVLRRRPETSVLVWGDQLVPYGKVVGLMTELQAAGAPAVGLVTENPPMAGGK
jgi:biopolymer transport protein TolR